MPPPRPCWPAMSLMRLREVDCPPRLAGLASWEDWHGSCFYSELIASFIERSSLFVKELSFPQTTTDDAFFNWNWAGACWDRWVGPLALDAALPCKKKKRKGSRGARPLPLQCLSQLFHVERKDKLLRERMFYIPFTDGVTWYL